MHAGIYIRRSRDDQSEYSPEAQERQCRLFCELQGFTVYQLYIDDDYSGRLATRPAFDRMLRDARAGKIQAVVVHKIDRYARNAELLLRTVDELDKLRVRFLSVSENIDYTTPVGRMILTTMAGVAEYYSNNLGTETRKGLQEKAAQGGWVGPVPVGYRKADGVLVPDPQYAPLVQRIFAAYATGVQSYTSIADTLNAEGHRTPGGQHFGRETVRTILLNRAYLGLVSCSDVEYPGQHQPLVSAEVWAAAAAVRAGRATGNHGQHVVRNARLLTEILYCSECGARLWWHRSHHTCYYRCSGRASHRTCNAPMVRASLIEGQVMDLLQRLALPDDLLEDVITAAEHMQQRDSAPTVTPGQVQERLRRLGVSYRLGDLSDQEYLGERERLQAMLASVPAPFGDLRQAARQLANISDWLAAADMVDRRIIVRQIFNRLWANKSGLQVVEPTMLYLPLIDASVEVFGGCLMGVRLAPRIA